MKKIYSILLYFFIAVSISVAQPVIWFESFENDSVFSSSGWNIYNTTAEKITPEWNWTIRTVGSPLPGIPPYTCVVHSGSKSIGVSWWAGTSLGITDAWLVTPKLHDVPSNSVFSFWMTGGGQQFSDSVSIWISIDSTPGGFLSNPANEYENISFSGSFYGNYSIHLIDLAAYQGQSIYIGFRYNMNTLFDGYFIQLDDVSYSGPVEIKYGTNTIPEKFSLQQNYPNPFNPLTKISYALHDKGKVLLKIFDTNGKEVSTLVNKVQDAGNYSVSFDANGFSSGVYFYSLSSGDYKSTKRMLLLK